MPRGGMYYWAGGRKVRLTEAPQVAVDVPAAGRARLWEGALADAAAEVGTKVSADLILVPATALSPALRGRLDQAGALQPVYRHTDGTLLVVLPEVRVETSDPATTAALHSAVEEWDTEIGVEQPRPGRFLLKPASHSGEEALDLANHVVEQVEPDAAQARFVRIVPEEGDT